LLCELDRRKALIVHFSHLSNMREGGVFPDDLQNAVVNKDSWNLSCCVIWPGHTMDLPGEVGVIFRPTAVGQVLSTKNDDAGSVQLTDTGQDVSGGDPLSEVTLQTTFDVALGTYNEWRMKGADVTGIFVTSERGISAKKQQSIECDGKFFDDTIGLASFTIAEVFAAFPSFDIFTMTPDGPLKLKRMNS
jgi:hypothetical protein